MNKSKKTHTFFSEEDMRRVLTRLAHQIIEKTPQLDDLVFLGIQTRGVYLSRRLQKIVEKIEGITIPLGELDITLYRDDLTMIGPNPLVKKTKIDFDINKKVVVLIDDVLYTGRTIRAALDEIIDFGRPKRVELLVLIDRGHRELPIRADYVGKNIPTAQNELVEVHLKEIDKRDGVVIMVQSNRDCLSE